MKHHTLKVSFVQLSWGMSYAGTVICEISHLILISVSPIASQHRFYNEVHDFCILYQNVWIKLIWQLKLIFKTPMLVWKEISTTVFKLFFVKGLISSLWLFNTNLYRDQFNDGMAQLHLKSQMTWRELRCSSHVTAMSLTRLLNKPQPWEKRAPTELQRLKLWNPCRAYNIPIVLCPQAE